MIIDWKLYSGQKPFKLFTINGIISHHPFMMKAFLSFGLLAEQMVMCGFLANVFAFTGLSDPFFGTACSSDFSWFGFSGHG